METIEVKGDKEYEVKLTGFELVTLTSLIDDLPYKLAKPVVHVMSKIEQQIKQQTDANISEQSKECEQG